MNPPFKPLRVVHILRPGIGGAAKHLELLVKHWNDPHIRLSVISSPLENPDFPKTLQPFVERVWEVPMEREVRLFADSIAFWKIFNILRKERFDVVHTHASKAGLLGRIAAFLLGIPRRIYTPHGFYFFYNIALWKKCFYFLLEFFLAPITSQMICLTSVEAKQARWLTVQKKIVEIPNALDIPSFLALSERIPDPLPAPLETAEECLMMVARLSPPKDPFTPIRAFPALLASFPRLKLVVIGEGELRNEAELLMKQLQLEEAVFFLGARTDVPALLKRSTISILSSFWEGLPYILLESLASKVPVVASHIPGHTQVIQDRINGRLFKTGDTNDFTRVAQELLLNTQQRQHLAHIGFETVQTHYSLEGWRNRFRQLYKTKDRREKRNRNRKIDKNEKKEHNRQD